MNDKLFMYLKSNFSYFFTIIAVWVVAVFFLFAFQVEETSTLSISKATDFYTALWSGFFSGIIWGGVFKIAFLIKNKLPTYWISVLVSVGVNILSAYLLIYCMYHLAGIFYFEDFPNNIHQLLELYNSQLFYAILAYFFIVGTLIEIFYDIDRKLGKGILSKFLLGRYYKPREEERIFLFMDLQSSTHYAEKLGHFKYSRLIQDCFKDISNAVKRNNAQIYQYVGDEVVLTWKMKDGLKGLKCLKIFFDFNDTIEKKKKYYQEEYQMIPVFKAGVHSGKVMVAEVGELKSEIAYHGDAINTASRIQGLCNEYSSRLLVSKSLLEELENENKINCWSKNLGPVSLDGKAKLVELYSFQMN